MKRVTVALILGAGLLVTDALAIAEEVLRVAQSTTPPAGAPSAGQKPAVSAGAGVTIRGTIAAIDKEARTVTLKGPRGRTLTLDVRDPQKLDLVKVGDPVVATYVEALALEVRKSGAAAPGVSVQESRVASKPGETPGGAIGRQVTLTGTITAVNKKQRSVTIKGPQGNEETVKVKDPKHLENIKAGDVVELTYTQALAVSLDKREPR